MKYFEIYNDDFISRNYIVSEPPISLKPYIDFYWETNYDKALPAFSVLTFPRIGSTLLFNLKGTFRFSNSHYNFVNDDHLCYRRNQVIESIHLPDSKLFGIQFKINLPELCCTRKQLNKRDLYHANELLDKQFIGRLTAARTFEERIKETDKYFTGRITRKIELKADIINKIVYSNAGSLPGEKSTDTSFDFIPYSKKTIERYFKECTGVTPQKAVQIHRTRTALSGKVKTPDRFDCTDFGFYDHSHFYKSLKNLKAGY